MVKNSKKLGTLSLVILSSCYSCSSGSGGNSTSSTSLLNSQAQAIYDSMSLDERIGQLILPNYGLLMQGPNASASACDTDLHDSQTPDSQIIKDCGFDQIGQYHIGAVLQGGGPLFPDLSPTAQNWQRVNALATQVHSESNSYDPILLIGNDAVHMNMHVQGGVMGPQNIGLGATHDPELVQQVQNLAALDSLATGFNWIYAPTVAVVHDQRWGRTYEGFGIESSNLKALASASIEGLQEIQDGKITGVLATAKHFLGDGDTQYGLDEGDDKFTGSESEFWAQNGYGYEASLNANVGSIMASYSAVNGNTSRMHFGGKWDIINQFKGSGIQGTDGKTYQFQGFIVSDWEGATRAAYLYTQTTGESLTLPQIFAKSINAGVDMQMVATGDTQNPFNQSSPLNYSTVGEVFDAIKTAYTSGLISEDTLHDAVIRILKVKLTMQPQDISLSQYTSIQAQERTAALKAAKESLILLKNQNSILPVSPSSVHNVVFVGDTNDIGIQNGGWSINWQGQKGNQYFTGNDQVSSGAMTIESAVINQLGSGINYYYVNESQNSLPNGLGGESTLVIGVVHEVPYAEYMGDIANGNESDAWYYFGATTGANQYLNLPQSHAESVAFTNTESGELVQLKMSGAKVVTIIYSGRPVILRGYAGSPDPMSDVEIAAFLPGTTGGQAVSDAIFGNYHFGSNGISNKLPFPWPADMIDVIAHFPTGGLYNVGYGLTD